jgi:CheY-like chemotaxis protein
MPDFKGPTGDALWREGGVRCVLLPSGTGMAVELRSEHGGVFLRKLAPTDLIILGYRLPDLHGRDVCRQLRANPETGQAPILVVTASTQDDADSDCPDAVLTKPCLLPTLLAASHLLLSRVLPTAVSRSPTAPPA